MKKMAYVSVTYLYSFEPSDLGLSKNCSEQEFEKAVEAHMSEETSNITLATGRIENDIEITLCGF